MSFITKRERVFNEYDVFDLPARNEGKLKTYASCTDTRAWSHFCSDKSEHLVEIIKRNNETVRPKYIPTDVIVNTLMSAKNAEIARLKRKIEEFEQMLSSYDQLDLTCEQKCDIANAHAAIKAANKELDDLCLDLDLSGFTEGVDSEAFETGKSRGDEPIKYNFTEETEKSGRSEIKAHGEEWSYDKVKESTPRKETKGSQAGPPCTCDASTSAHDTLVDEMQETIINKDAKLSAMQNTLAVMEHDVCEPYCIYAHIYTALEKIFGTLCQNGKYKEYLDLLTAGKDTRGVDIKGKILFKMKVLEKFSLALIAPCSQEFGSASKDCTCFRAEVVTTFALTSAESQKSSLDSKRAQLVADIMENQEMKEILSKESLCLKVEDDRFDECFAVKSCSVDVENLNRLKSLQANYNELLTCFDNLKHDRDVLFIRCQKFADLEVECECLKNNLREYNELWKEKEYYRKRSEHLDTLKENYFILSEETSNIETKLKAEQAITKIKSQTNDQLRNENIKLEKKIGDTSVLFEKQKNDLIFKLKECECKIMCQDQQIKSLSEQIDKLLEQDKNKILTNEDALCSVELIDEIESQKDQIKNLKDDLCGCEEEKQYLQGEIEKRLEQITVLKFDVEDWKSRYEEVLKLCNYTQMQVDELQGRNLLMNQELENKTSAIDNLNYIICSKSLEISNLMDKVQFKKDENINLMKQIKNSRESFDENIALLLNEKKSAFNSIIMAKQESVELLKHLKENNDKNQTYMIDQLEKLEVDKNIAVNSIAEEIDLLHHANLENINILHHNNEQLKKKFDLARQQSLILEQKLLEQENLLETFEKLKKSHENLLNEKETLQLEVHSSKLELDNLYNDFELTKKDSESLLHESEDIKEQYGKLNVIYQKVLSERNISEKKIFEKDLEVKHLIQSLHSIQLEHKQCIVKIKEIPELEKNLIELQNKYDELLLEKNILENDLHVKTQEINNLYNNLESKIEDNQRLQNHIRTKQSRELLVNESISALKSEHCSMQINLNAVREESATLLDKIKQYENMEDQYKELQVSFKELKSENENLLQELNDSKKIYQENFEYSKSLENALVRTRDENLSKTYSVNDFYEDLKKEVEKLREEKIKSHKEMKILMDKLDESEYLITSLNEDILAREKQISTLENHINELQVEITALQNNLKEVVESGEELKELSYEKLEQTIKKLEAHQSKATHNMKIDIAKLRNEKENLENRLSSTQLTNEESDKEKNKYITVINQLENEMESIIADIKKLEISSIGYSNIEPNKSSINDILMSLDRIGKYVTCKKSSIEQTLRNVQASSQLLKLKADEAKAIAEKELNKNIYEKEQIKIERIEIENQLENLKEKMKEEKANYEKFIKDLEGENLNQQLIFEKIKQSKEQCILKIIPENQRLRDQCDNYDIEIKEIKQKLHYASEQKSKYKELIENTNKALEMKDNLIIELQNQIKDLKNKATPTTTNESGVQTILLVHKISQDNICQTDTLQEVKKTAENVILSVSNISEDAKISDRIVKNYPTSDNLYKNDTQQKHQILEFHPTGSSINEVQVLTANVEPKIDFVRNIYLKYKIKRLSPGKLEQHSIASLYETKFSHHQTQSNELFSETQIRTESLPSRSLNPQLHLNNDSIIDIYNTKISSNSTKLNSDIHTDTIKKDCFENDVAEIETKNQEFKDVFNINTKVMENDRNLKDSIQLSERDLFVIYKDSSSNYDAQNLSLNVKNINNKLKTRQNNSKQSSVEENIYVGENTSEDRDDDSIKPKLQIKLPRVIYDSPLVTNSDDGKKSSDTFVSPQWGVQYQTNEDSEKIELNLFSVPTSSKNQIKDYFPENTMIQQYIDNRTKYNSTHSNNIINPAKNNSTFSRNSNPKLSRVGGKILVLGNTESDNLSSPSEDHYVKNNFGLQYILNTMQNEINPSNIENLNMNLRKSHSVERISNISESSQSKLLSPLIFPSVKYSLKSKSSPQPAPTIDRGILVNMDDLEDYKKKILELTKALSNIEKHYTRKIEAVKMQYDSNVKSVINEHNHGVRSIQNLHEETLQDIKKIHENEVENLRTMSIEAMREVEKLQFENRFLKSKFKNDNTVNLNEEPTKMHSDLKRRKCRCCMNSKTLTKTNVEAFNVRPRRRSHGPCTCSLDMSISGSIRNIFEQVDIDQRKMGERAYIKYIVNKVLDGNIESLDAQELSFLHLKVCQTWKTKLNIEETKQMKIDTLETEWNNKQRQNQKHMAELDRQVAEERRRLQEVREALCFSTNESRDSSPAAPTLQVNAAEKDVCNYNTTLKERRSAGDVTSGLYGVIATSWKRKCGKLETSRAVLAKLDVCDGRRDKALVNDETPTRLKRARDRLSSRTHKK